MLKTEEFQTVLSSYFKNAGWRDFRTNVILEMQNGCAVNVSLCEYMRLHKSVQAQSSIFAYNFIKITMLIGRVKN